MIVDNTTIMDSLYCEWAYIVNLDTNELEVYKGFQDTLHHDGRYGGEVPDPGFYLNGNPKPKYYGCALVVSYPLDAIPENFSELVERLAYPENFEDEDAA